MRFKPLFSIILLIFISSCVSEQTPATQPIQVTTGLPSTQPMQVTAGLPPTWTDKPPTITPEPEYHTQTPSTDPYTFMEISPDGNYVAKLYYDPLGNTIQIQSKDGELLGEVSTHYDEYPGDPHPHLSIYKWSVDSKIFYYYYPNRPDGGDYAFWWDGLDLHSYIVESGEINPVLPGDGQMAFSFSPDETYIAYTRSQDDPFVLNILNLSDGSQKSVTIQQEGKNYLRVGNIIWSPSGTDLVFQTEDQDHWIETLFLEIDKMDPRVIWEYDYGTFIAFEGWEEGKTLRFFDYFEDDVYTINVQDLLKYSLGTPTPKP